jgi:hypothetical protein
MIWVVQKPTEQGRFRSNCLNIKEPLTIQRQLSYRPSPEVLVQPPTHTDEQNDRRINLGRSRAKNYR